MGLFSWLRGKPEAAAEARADDDRLHANDSADADSETENAPDATALAEQIESRNGGARVDAARALLEGWRAGDAASAEALAKRVETLLEDDEAIVRQIALSAVRLMRKPENLARVQSSVLARLADPAAPVRIAAVWAAAHLPDPVAREQVRAQLKSPEESTRFAAACALAEKKDSRALEELGLALEADHRRQEALSAMMALGDIKAIEPVGALFERERLGEFDRTLAAATLARFGDARGATHLIARIEEPGDDRPIATEWAGRIGVRAAIPAILALADRDGDVSRGAALVALGRLHADGAFEKLRALASDDSEDEDVRMDSVEGLAELGTAEARALLESLAKAEDELGALCQELLAEIHANDARASAEKSVEPTQSAGPDQSKGPVKS